MYAREVLKRNSLDFFLRATQTRRGSKIQRKLSHLVLVQKQCFWLQIDSFDQKAAGKAKLSGWFWRSRSRNLRLWTSRSLHTMKPMVDITAESRKIVAECRVRVRRRFGILSMLSHCLTSATKLTSAFHFAELQTMEAQPHCFLYG